jgi:hypothetical protein
MPDDPISDAFKFLKQEIRALLDERVRQRIRDTIPSCRDLTEADHVFALSAALLVVQKDMSYDHDDLPRPSAYAHWRTS